MMKGLKGATLVAIATPCLLWADIVGAQDTRVDEPPVVAASKVSPGSLYLQCDGNPNNMSAGESVARFVGAVTLLALFAPKIETPDPAKRRFGADGVAACSQLIDGPRAEGQTVRRLPLILGRALHKIEAGDYRGASADVDRSRAEAAAAKLVGDPYFDRSLGISFDLIQAEALSAAGDVAAARAVALRRATRFHYGWYTLVGIDGFRAALSPPSDDELAARIALARIEPPEGTGAVVDLLEEDGRFAEAAAWLAAFEADVRATFPRNDFPTTPIARGAVDLALAGDWTAAPAAAERARSNASSRDAAGKPEADAATSVELLDFYDLLAAAHAGDLATARRRYGARSKWVAPSFGEQVAALRLLRTGASDADNVGALASTPEQLWTQRRDIARASRLELYKNNKWLWSRILPYASAPAYEALSHSVWNGARSSMLSKATYKDSAAFTVVTTGGVLTQRDAIMLHCAVAAKARGHPGFFLFAIADRPDIAFVRFADAAGASPYFLDADSVIAELKDVIPTEAELDRRRLTREKAINKGG